MYLVTEGELWSDRVELFSDLLQRSRLGGMALRRNQIFPGHLVSWRFAGAPTAAENVAILIADASPTHFKSSPTTWPMRHRRRDDRRQYLCRPVEDDRRHRCQQRRTSTTAPHRKSFTFESGAKNPSLSPNRAQAPTIE